MTNNESISNLHSSDNLPASGTSSPAVSQQSMMNSDFQLTDQTPFWMVSEFTLLLIVLVAILLLVLLVKILYPKQSVGATSFDTRSSVPSRTRPMFMKKLGGSRLQQLLAKDKAIQIDDDEKIAEIMNDFQALFPRYTAPLNDDKQYRELLVQLFKENLSSCKNNDELTQDYVDCIMDCGGGIGTKYRYAREGMLVLVKKMFAQDSPEIRESRQPNFYGSLALSMQSSLPFTDSQR